MKWIDIPPVWLVGFLVLAWLQATYLPVLPFRFPVLSLICGLLVGGGVLLMALALIEFRKHKTTPIPHEEANALITAGIFSRTRNPIYLGDAMVLTGLSLYWGAWPSLIFVPLFVLIITRRFIVPEETRLKRRFGPSFILWSEKTPRWLL
ncbi:isoprenylcysteine carboxylmethyltransferase family protein [Actibacterium sp. 188UL27-1]|uniref:methyltransferase family protein n=1 Tax=Actibacterium sp. 188UL27-1 TaxID=2786961 RepID=UPI0019582C06|nr:isoprenylcysteine carboxylmethyltransferase family protein [Actibacterium sp. 188UL27-1]MBM7067960.1 isoprenylcysteine carboxylmethyltransferase family protein [Actibacterium sp. 188UL27-1]